MWDFSSSSLSPVSLFPSLGGGEVHLSSEQRITIKFLSHLMRNVMVYPENTGNRKSDKKKKKNAHPLNPPQ